MVFENDWSSDHKLVVVLTISYVPGSLRDRTGKWFKTSRTYTIILNPEDDFTCRQYTSLYIILNHRKYTINRYM